jgi:hypothetical protein
MQLTSIYKFFVFILRLKIKLCVFDSKLNNCVHTFSPRNRQLVSISLPFIHFIVSRLPVR